MIFNYPFVAIELVLSNAVYYRCYQINEPITIRITPTSIEITSFPEFDSSISDKKIAEFNITSPFYRNRRIWDILKGLHLIEGRNTGYPTILNALKENDSPYPKFEMDSNRTYLTVILQVHHYFLPNKNTLSQKEVDYRNRIKFALSDNNLSLNELAKAMGYKGITAKLFSTINEMLKKGNVEKTMIDSSIKLRLTK